MKVFLRIEDEDGGEISLRPFKGDSEQGLAVLTYLKNGEVKGTFELEKYHMIMLVDSLSSILEGSAILRETGEGKNRIWNDLDFKPYYKAIVHTKSTAAFHLFVSDETGDHFVDLGATEDTIMREFEECPAEKSMPRHIYEKVAGKRLWMYERIVKED